MLVTDSLGSPTQRYPARLTLPNQVLRQEATGEYYRWDGQFPKDVPENSTPDSTGGVGAGAWLSVGDAVLRGEITDVDGATKYPELQMARWRDEGDVRGWGATCDGITDDAVAINQAINDTGGNISIPYSIFVKTHIVIKNMKNPVIKFKNGASASIGTNFSFSDSYRGIFVFDGCDNPAIVGATIIGAKLDKTTGGADPIEDGDAGIEYMNCTGLCHTINPLITDVKTWGVIHVNVQDYHVENAVMKNCQVQSGIGGTGVRTALVTNPIMYDIGLYGVEIETVNSNRLSSVIGGVIRNSRNAVSIVNNSDNIIVVGTIAMNCFNGFTSETAPSDASTIPENVKFSNTNAISCKNGYSLNYVNNNTISDCATSRMDTEYYARTNSYDRVYKMNGSIAYCPTKKGSTAPAVGSIIEFDNGKQKTIATIEPNIIDPVFGELYGFTCTEPLTSDYMRRSFKRYIEVVTLKRGVVMYGGSGNIINNCTFKQDTDLLVSYGNHDRLQWNNNFAKTISRYFTQGSSGTVSGNINIDTFNCDNVGSWGDATKFGPAFKTKRTYSFKGGTTNDLTKIQNAIPISDGFVSGISCAVNAGQTTTGNIVFKFNGSNVITAFSGNPLRGSATFSPIGVSGAAICQLTDTVGDLVASGYAVEINGIFK